MLTQTITRVRPFIHSRIPKLYPAVPEDIVKEPRLFIAALAHEIRNPITNINLAIEMLSRLVTQNEQKIYLDIIRRASSKVNSLINEVVREQQPEQSLAKEYSMHQLLDEVLLMASDRLLLKNITTAKVYAVRDYIKGIDRPAIKIALTNIIINAIDAMPINGQLKLVTQIVAGKYTIQIEDNGCGISVENLKHIFEPYFTSKKDGLGIGLAATHDIFKASRVNVKVESEEGTRTKFTLSFPRKQTISLENKVYR